MKFLKSLTSKVVSCPQCMQKLRVPVKKGKTLEVSCKKCGAKFNLQFQTPLGQVFRWYKGYGLRYNLRSFALAYKAMPYQAKLGFWVNILLFCVIFSMISSLAVHFLGLRQSPGQSQVPQVEEHIKY